MTVATKPGADALTRFVNERIADLQQANATLFELDRDTTRDRERNDREVSWLNDLVETISTTEWSFGGFGEKWQAEAEKHLSPAPEGLATKPDGGVGSRHAFKEERIETTTVHEDRTTSLAAVRQKAGVAPGPSGPTGGEDDTDYKSLFECHEQALLEIFALLNASGQFDAIEKIKALLSAPPVTASVEQQEVPQT